MPKSSSDSQGGNPGDAAGGLATPPLGADAAWSFGDSSSPLTPPPPRDPSSIGVPRTIADTGDAQPSSHGQSGNPGNGDQLSDADRDPLAGSPRQIGPYHILQKLGEGGMGIVYRAEQHVPIRRIVALKVIKIGMDTREVVVRFEAERQALALMTHPNVARVLDVGETEAGRPYFVMEYVPGVPLTEFCDQQKLTVRQRLALFIDVCHAVQHAHQKGIIHRDLKPSNILVSNVDAKAVAKVIDFGIAKATKQSLTDRTLQTLSGALIGTPEYAAPEQAITGGVDVDTRADIYSLGVILYQLLTGTLPLDTRTLRREGPEGIARVLREVEPPKPSTRINQLRKDTATGNTSYHALISDRQADPRSFRRDLQGDLDWITLKAMEKDRVRRYATANDLAADVARYLAHEPVEARPPSKRYRVVKFVRRHRVGVAGVTIMALLLVAGVLGTTAGMVQARYAQSQAEQAKAIAEAERKRAETALADAQAARLRAAEEASKAVVAAEKLLSSRSGDAEQLAGPAWRAISAGLGADHPLALEAGDVVGRVLLARGKHAEAVTVLRDVVNRARAAAASPATGPSTVVVPIRIAPHGRFFSDLADALRAEAEERAQAAAASPTTKPAVAGNDVAAEAIDLQREALAVFRADPADRSSLRLDVGERLANTFVAAGRIDEAEQAYRQTLVDHRKLLGEGHDRTRRLIDRLATVLLQNGRFEKATEIVQEQLKRTDAEVSDSSKTNSTVSRQVDVADALLRNGKLAEGVTAFQQAIEQSRKLRPGAEGTLQLMWRQLMKRIALATPSEWASESLRGNAWVAIDEALSRSPSRAMGADELRWGEAQFQLHQWNGAVSPGDPTSRPAAPTLRAEGPLANLKRLIDPPPGLYLLAIQVPRKGSERPLRAATWVLMADWQLALFEPTATFSPTNRAASHWNAMNGRPPTARLRQSSLLLLDEGNINERIFGIRIGQGPHGRVQDWGATASASVSVPPGTYRVVVASDDGVRLHMRDKATETLVIDSWRSRPLQTDTNVVEITSGQTPELRAEYFQGTGEYVLRVQLEPFAPQADELIAQALGPNSIETRRYLVREAQWWERLGKWPEATACYERATQIGSRYNSIDQDMLLQTLRGLARAMAKVGRQAEVAPLVERTVADAAAAKAGANGVPSGEVAGETLLFAARERFNEGKIEPARALCDKAFAAVERLPGLADSHARRVARRAALLKLGAAATPNDGSLAAQLWCALDEVMLDNPSLIPAIMTVSAPDIAWKLVAWDLAGSNPAVAQGTLAGVGTEYKPAAGAYLVQFRFPSAGETKELTTAQWLLFASYEATVFQPPGEGTFDRNAWHLINLPIRAVAHPELASLAMIDALRAEPQPEGPAHRFAFVASSRWRLPAGRYRVWATAADGVRVIVGDRQAIKMWPARQVARSDFGDVDFDDSPRPVTIDHYRQNAEHKLFVRVEPLDAKARSLAESLGWKPRSPEIVRAELDDAIREDAYYSAAFTTRGALKARAGDKAAAAANFNAAGSSDQTDPLSVQLRLAAAMQLGDEPAHRRIANEFLNFKFPGKDRTAAARTATSLLLSPRKPDGNREKIDSILQVATTPSQLGPTPPQSLLARALMNHRLGLTDKADASLAEAKAAGALTASPAHAVQCDLVAALIHQSRGQKDEARAALSAATEAMSRWESGSDRQWDVFETFDWMACQVLKREAEARRSAGTARRKDIRIVEMSTAGNARPTALGK